jgi:hypothetical protein
MTLTPREGTTMPQVTSAHPSFKPKLVARWEKHVENAESNEEAQTQLGYDLLVELRSIKILLVWVR